MSMLHGQKVCVALCCGIVVLCGAAKGQTPGSQNPDTAKPKTHKRHPRKDDQPHPASASPGPAIKNLLRDQRDIWTSPFKARVEDMKWLVPMIGLSAGLINADAEVSRRVNVTGTIGKHSGTVSNVGIAVALAGPGVMWRVGRWGADAPQREKEI